MKNKIKKFIKERHWTTKLVWGVGLAWILITVLTVLIFPPGIAFKEYKIISGEVVSKGILNKSEGSGYPSNITCTKAEDCPFSGGIKACNKNKLCLIGTTIQKPVEDSYGIKTPSGEIIGVIGGNLKIGEHVKVAVEGNNVKEKGDWLWNKQIDSLKDIFLRQKCFYFALGCDCLDGCWYIFLTIPMFVVNLICMFLLINDSFNMRLITSLFYVWFIIPSILFSFTLIPIASLQYSYALSYYLFLFIPPLIILVTALKRLIHFIARTRGVKKSR